MKCKDCTACYLGWFESKPDKYVCIGVREPFIIKDINHECTEYKIEHSISENSITKKQKNLIEDMNEFCDEYFDLSIHRTKKEASEYISRNIDEYKLKLIDNWGLQYL